MAYDHFFSTNEGFPRFEEARELTLALGGCWFGGYGKAPCPVCQPERRKKQDALTVATGQGGRLLLNCKKSGCGFCEVLAAAGLPTESFPRANEAAQAEQERKMRATASKKEEQSKRLWHEAEPIAATAAEGYLRRRVITCPLPASLRFIPDCWHGPTACLCPALIAKVEGADGFAVHRTYLRPDGSDKAGLDGGDKLTLGRTRGGAMRLSEGPGRLVVAEGIESALSLLCGLIESPMTVWAALSTGGMRRLRLPPEPGSLMVACDGDKPGREAAGALAERADALGWKVGMLDPGDGLDWNDILIAKGGAA